MSILILLFWIIFPFMVFIASSFLVEKFHLKKRFKIKPVDIALPLLFIGIHGLSAFTYQASIVPYFLISILLLGISVAFFQAYFYEEIVYPRFIKMFWRLSFLMILLVYVFLIIASVVNMFV
ncbi:Protein of unknown function [Pilibacter termitis]|uniref:DUF3397 domain-containing protein n=1 Tax=Pilibacter termitis TaxID=263852 RepID=A0A1T4KEF3_9ENTE|nr:DUF3397 domain-containing protein [Pilibacter termitis]SJZ40766.1 Protein of unknown function [Pilibacter termitis]